MATFFEQQDRARRNTHLLVLLMGLGVFGMGCALYVLISFLEQKGARLTSSGEEHPPGFFQLQLLLSCVVGTAVAVTLASASRALSLRGGGAQIAEMLGGRLVSGSPRDVLEKRLVNVVEEMAIASGVPVPQVFVLDAEQAINAFAAGFTPDDAAIAVTRGCLEKLTRDELQGVIGHEFSHVLNGDMRLNVRLMGIVFGIVCIGLLGRLLMRMGMNSSYATVSRRERDASPGAMMFMIGLGVIAIGSVGELFGKLIKAAVSRQREFLADASAVQFTRNPQGIAGALKKIGGLPAGGSMVAPHADEASHFFFGDIHKRLFDGSILATHPPLAERVKRIDPSFAGEFPEVGEGVAQPEEGPVLGFAAGSASAAQGTPASEVVDRIGTASPEALEHGRRLIDALPAQLRSAATSPFAACATVYALLLSDDDEVKQAQQRQISALAGHFLLVETERLWGAVQALRRSDRMPLVSLLAPALRLLSRDQRAVFSHTVQALIDADHAVSIFEYVVAQTLRERLSEESGAHARSRVRYSSLKGVHEELELLLSLLAHAGDFDGTGAGQAFAAGAERLQGEQLTLLAASTRLLSGLSAALCELRALAPSLCEQVVDACAHVVLADRRVTDDEATLLCAVCDALGCPLPPFVEQAEA